jgi:vancomycin resistance protein YoaR
VSLFLWLFSSSWFQDFLAGGVSDFSHSSKNRLANIDAGMKQVRGALVPPGQIFSFGEKLGDVTAEKGFKPEIVIKADGLKPELGGGICQVSSTLFRAVMQSGMQITQRRNHAFSVNHYFPPGTDATIYTPVTDLKFKNDTPAYVLIWPYYLDKDHLAFDLYGTKDGRSVVVDEPVQWDRKPDGSLKASWSRHVTMNGITRDDTLKSNYLPPALFKKEEKFVIASQATTPPNSVPETENITTDPLALALDAGVAHDWCDDCRRRAPLLVQRREARNLLRGARAALTKLALSVEPREEDRK